MVESVSLPLSIGIIGIVLGAIALTRALRSRRRRRAAVRRGREEKEKAA
jgi:hypothetical protein